MQKKLSEEWKQTKLTHYYLAQLALEVRRLWYGLYRKKMKKEDLNYFILDVDGSKQKKRKAWKDMTPQERAERIAISKSYWGTLSKISNGELKA